MYDIKLGQGCGIKATLLTPAGGVCDLRRSRYIAASLVLPSGATMNCADIAFNEVTNAVYVRLLGTRELTAAGRYGIIFNAKLEDKTMYSTPVVYFAEVSTDAATGYHELTLSLALTVVGFPDNVSYTGASPKISDKNTWLTYDDDLNAYVDTGIEVGYANLLSRYDAEIEQLIGQGNKVTKAAETAAKAATEATAIIEEIEGSAVTIDVQPNHIYKCGELTSLAIRSVVDSVQIAEVIFTSGATATELSLPDALADNVTGWKIPLANKTYKMFFQSNTVTINE